MRKFISYIIVDLNTIKRQVSDGDYHRIPFVCDNALSLARKALAMVENSATKQAVEAEAESRCPLYVDYKKSCTAWQHRKKELNRSA